EQIREIPNLVVISSSDVDQQSYFSPDLRTTLFGKHLIEGISGAADTSRDKRIDAGELFAYVKRHVEYDARLYHGAAQTPVLLPRGEGEERARKISLTFQLEPLEEEPASSDPVPQIQAAWKPYLDYAPRAPSAVACLPRQWKLWQAWLVRHEQL